MKNKNDLVIDLNRTKQELLEYLKEYKHKDDYIRVSSHSDYDVCLELTWQQHCEPFVEFYYLANVVGNQLVGRIVKPTKNKAKDHGNSISFKDIIEISWNVIIGLLFIYGVPFVLFYAISERLFLSIGLGAIPLLIIFIVSGCDHIQVHKENIIKAIKGF